MPHSPKVLLVDDNPTNLKVLNESLRGEGWTTLVAIDGESAIEQTEYAKPDLILLDVMMPGIDGFETCRRLKANTETQLIPIIFMTALSDTVDKVRGLSLGAVDYITKPFQQEEVIARAKLHLQLYQLTRALATQNQELERRVAERTAELSESLHNLQQTQLQLVQGEKMATLGQLVAGVAHEINNPVGFISGNLRHAEHYVQSLLNLLSLYQEHFPDPGEAITEEMENMDLDYLSSDLPKLITSMKDGTERIRGISHSLRSFARTDTGHKTEFILEEGLDSTIMILKYRLKSGDGRGEIQIQKDYAELPPINCYPGQLNQVFMNILANAIDALDEMSEQAKAEGKPICQCQIVIHTALSSNREHVVIRIRDNALGIAPDVKARIFEPSFTTKPVGKGTGLGLSISHQIIVEKHGGTIDCYSTLGEGTEFIVTVPMV
ncbi:MAG: response regulator [Synechococcales bacterium]|nr:response regulator [Synechococcales bacterium]